MNDQSQKPAGGRKIRTPPPFERVALLLQGGGALGSYQCGVYESLAAHGLHPNCVAGVSIGAINAALVAGNAPEDRVGALRAFWERITAPPLGFPVVAPMLGVFAGFGDSARAALNRAHASVTTLAGAPGFFRPRMTPPFFQPPGTPEAESFYDTAPLRETLLDLVDFDRINRGKMQFSVGAVNVRSGNLVVFDNATCRIGPEHVMASGALPPGFPAVEVDGEPYWDGGLVSNTPLGWVLAGVPRQDTLAFQIDLWSARGEMPTDLTGLDLRQKDIRFSSRTRAHSDMFRKMQTMRRSLRRLLDAAEGLPGVTDADRRLLETGADETVYNLVHLIYKAKGYEGSSKDYEFSRGTMEEHWAAGRVDSDKTLRNPDVLRRPRSADGVAVFDLT